MPFQITTYNGSGAEREEYINFLHQHYRDDQFFQPPSPPPEAATCFLLRSNGQVCGHGAVTTNPGITVNNTRTALIGWYECTNDNHANQALLQAMLEHCTSIGAQTVVGPINGSTWHSYRFAQSSTASPFFLDVHHKPWYPEHFTNTGFHPLASYHSSTVLLEDVNVSRINEFVEHFSARGITIRSLEMENFVEELRRIYQVSTVAFQNNLFYTPLSEQEALQMYLPLRDIVDPEFVLIAEAEAKRPLGFAFAVPNLLAPKQDSLVIKTVAIRPEPSTRGLGTLLAEMLHERGKQHGYRTAIHALMQDQNSSTNVLRNHSNVIRTYTLYSKEL